MFTAGLLRLASQVCLFIMAGAIFLAVTQQANGWFVLATIFLGLAIFTQLKAKEKSIQAKVQIEEKERARIKARQR